MKVWVVMGHLQWEGSELVDIYLNEDAARVGRSVEDKMGHYDSVTVEEREVIG